MARKDRKDRRESAPVASGGASAAGGVNPAPAPAPATPPAPEAPKKKSHERDCDPLAGAVSLEDTSGGLSWKALGYVAGLLAIFCALYLIPWGDIWGWSVSHGWGLGMVPIVLGLGLLAWKKPGIFWSVTIIGGITGGILYFFWWEGQQCQKLMRSAPVAETPTTSGYKQAGVPMHRETKDVEVGPTGATGWIEIPIKAQGLEFDGGGYGFYISYPGDLDWTRVAPSETGKYLGCRPNVFRFAPYYQIRYTVHIAYWVPE